MVKGWQNETIFYINSYGRLALTTPTVNSQQIENPQEINKFWKWLFTNQHRVENLIDIEKIKQHLKNLNQKYKNIPITINQNKQQWIEEIIPKEDKFAINVRDSHDRISIMVNPKREPLLFDEVSLKAFIERIKA